MIRRFAIATAAAIALAAWSAPASAQRVQVGTLDCDISGGLGFIIGSRKDVTCGYIPADRGPREVYIGSISKFGLDIGGTSGGQMVWAVYTDTAGPRRGALAGQYAGASAEATVALGLGANVLVGGSERSIALQPLSLQGQAGLNVAVGVTELTLRAAR